MSPRRAWVLLSLTGLSVGLTYVLVVLNGSTQHDATAAWNGFGEVTSWSVLMLTASALAVLVASRAPGNGIATVFSAGGFLGVLTVLGDQYAGYALITRPGTAPGGVAARFVSFLAFAATWFLAGVLVPALFPMGRLLSRRWRPAVWLGAVGAGAWSLIVFLPRAFDDDGLLGHVPSVRNPIAITATADVFTSLSDLGVLALFAGMFLAIGSLVVRAVRARGDERQQVKIVAYTVAITTAIQLAVANTIDLVEIPGGQAIWNAVSTLAVMAIPVSIGLAIVRYRLYDVDRLIKRTISYTLLTALLAGAYAGSVFVLGAVTRPITRGSDLAVAGATLVIAALFRPLRRRVQRFIDRRFDRTRYDAGRALEAFAARLREETDLSTLRSDIEALARETMRPEHVRLWLRDEGLVRRVLR